MEVSIFQHLKYYSAWFVGSFFPYLKDEYKGTEEFPKIQLWDDNSFFYITEKF